MYMWEEKHWMLQSAGVFERAWSDWVPPGEKRRPAGGAETLCGDVVGQLHPFLCQLVYIGSPAKHNDQWSWDIETLKRDSCSPAEETLACFYFSVLLP